MKRVCSFFMAVLLCCSLVAQAFAATLTPLTEENTVAPGQKIVVTATVDQGYEDIILLETRMYFDSNLFTFDSAGTTDVAAGWNVAKNPITDKDTGKTYVKISIANMSAAGTSEAGVVAKLSFTANDTITEETATSFIGKFMGGATADADVGEGEEKSTPVTVTPASTEVKGYAVAASAENSSITVNEEARVALKISNSDETIKTYNAYYMEVSYDTNVLTYKGINTDAAITDNNGILKIAGYGDNKTCGTDNIVLTFTGKATGEAKVTVTSAKVDVKGNADAKDAPNAKITTDVATITVGGYQVSLPDGFTGAGTANPGEDYTFTANDTTKKYDFTGSTMGGEPVTVTDNGSGTYTISNVTGELDIKATALVKINLDNQAGAAIDGITNGQYVKPNTEINFTATSDAGKELEVTVNGEKITGVNRQGMYSYTIAADQVTGTELNIVVNYKSSTDTITIIGSGDAWSDVDHNSSVGWEKSGKVTDKATAALKIKPATGKTIEDYVVTINGETQKLTQAGRGPNTRYMVAFVPADVAKDNIIKIDVSYKKTEPTITVNVSEYLKLNNQSIFLITATCDELTESKVLAYGEKQMYWSEKYNNNNGAYAWLVIADGTKSLDALTAEAKTVIAAVDGTKAEIVYNGDVNQTTRVDINDAQLVWNMYNAQYSNFDTVNIRKFLEADMTADGKLDTADAAAIIALITK